MPEEENGRGKGQSTRSRPLRNNQGHNKFLDMKLTKAEQNSLNSELDKVSKIDDKVEPVERGTRASNLVEVECRECEYIFDVSPSLVPPGDSLGFICDDCLSEKGR